MKVLCDSRNPMATNTYLVYDESSLDAFIIDAASVPKSFVEEIENKNLKLKYLFLTHGHFDHTWAALDLKDKYKLKIVAHENERPVLTDADINMSSQVGKRIEFEADVYLKSDRGEFEGIKYILTPGHTCGGVCYHIEDKLFSGDTLFELSIGRTDFPTGNYGQLISSILVNLKHLPDETTVYPGHGEKTELGYERLNNPFLRRS